MNCCGEPGSACVQHLATGTPHRSGAFACSQSRGTRSGPSRGVQCAGAATTQRSTRADRGEAALAGRRTSEGVLGVSLLGNGAPLLQMRTPDLTLTAGTQTLRLLLPPRADRTTRRSRKRTCDSSVRRPRSISEPSRFPIPATAHAVSSSVSAEQPPGRPTARRGCGRQCGPNVSSRQARAAMRSW